MGNSEVGHMNMGAGRIVHMDITRIDELIASGAIFENELLLERDEARARRSNCTLSGWCPTAACTRT